MEDDVPRREPTQDLASLVIRVRIGILLRSIEVSIVVGELLVESVRRFYVLPQCARARHADRRFERQCVHGVESQVLGKLCEAVVGIGGSR